MSGMTSLFGLTLGLPAILFFVSRLGPAGSAALSLLLWAGIPVTAAVWLYRDAAERGRSGFFWGFLGVLFWPIILPLYVLVAHGILRFLAWTLVFSFVFAVGAGPGLLGYYQHAQNRAKAAALFARSEKEKNPALAGQALDLALQEHAASPDDESLYAPLFDMARQAGRFEEAEKVYPDLLKRIQGASKADEDRKLALVRALLTFQMIEIGRVDDLSQLAYQGDRDGYAKLRGWALDADLDPKAAFASADELLKQVAATGSEDARAAAGQMESISMAPVLPLLPEYGQQRKRLAAPGAGPVPAPMEAYLKARELQRRGNLRGAIAKLGEATKLQEEFPEAWVAAAEIYLLPNGDPAAGRRTAEGAISYLIQPDVSPALERRQVLLLKAKAQRALALTLLSRPTGEVGEYDPAMHKAAFEEAESVLKERPNEEAARTAKMLLEIDQKVQQARGR